MIYPVRTSPGYYETESSGYFPSWNYYYDKHQCIPNYVAVLGCEMGENTLDDTLLADGYEVLWERRQSNSHGIFKQIRYFVKGTNMIEVYYCFTTEEKVSSEDLLEEMAPEWNATSSDDMPNGYKVFEDNQPGFVYKSSDVRFYYQDYTEVEQIVKTCHATVLKAIPAGSISLIIKGEAGLRTQSFTTKIDDFDVSLHYGESFKHTYDVIVKRLNTKFDKGIVLFHGVPGCGKTSLVKLLTKHVKDKEVIFVPPYLIESIGSPDFIPFLLQHPNAILVIEDAEKVLLSRDMNEGSSQGVSSLLNISDGILGDCLNIQVICTFNTKKDKIDSALLRDGRLIALHEFGLLTSDESNKLLQHLGKDHVATAPMTLASIYGVGTEILQHKVEQQSSIGFKRY